MTEYILIILLLIVVFILVSLIVLNKRLSKQTNTRIDGIINEQKNSFTQLQSFLNIIFFIKPVAILPEFRNGWSVSPDFGAILLQNITKYKPKIIVELGSGVSTIISGYGLKKNEFGNIISLDHDKEFLKKTEDEIRIHQIENHAKVFFAELIPYKYEGETFVWYDLSNLPLNIRIDMLIIDGPPGYIQPLSRYLALPLLWDRLSENAVVIVDDSKRKDEEECINRWIKKYDLSKTYIDTETGTTILTKLKKDLT